MMEIEQYNEKKDEFVKLLKDQIDLSKRVKGWDCNDLENKFKKLQSEAEFNVLVVGHFSCGKSTFLNAILGEDILPSGNLETTAIITEISYSDKEKITLYSKDGKSFDIKKEELENHICINEKNGDKKYDKLVIKYPFDKKWKGIMFVDSPGFDGRSELDQKTKDYRSQADLIIYCMTADKPFDKHDKDRIEKIEEHEKIFAITKFDIVQINDAKKGRHEADKLKEYLTEKLKKYSKFGTNGVVFVDSLDALIAKEKNDENALKNSGFVEMEDKVSKILVFYKNKFPSMLLGLIKQNKKFQQHLQNDIDDSSKKREECERRLESLIEETAKIEEKIAKKDEMFTNIEEDLTAYRFQLECFSAIKDFIKMRRDDIPGWVEEGGSRWKEEFGLSKDKKKKYVEGVATYVTDKISTELDQWIRRELLMKKVNNKIIETINKYKEDLESLFEGMGEVNKNIPSKIKTSDQFDKGFLNESNITQLLLGNIAIGSVLMVLAGLLDLVLSGGLLYYIVSGIAGVFGFAFYTKEKIEEKRMETNKKIVEGIQEKIAEQEKHIQESVWKIVEESINKVLKQIKEKMEKQLKERRQSIDKEKSELHSSEKEFKNRIKLYREVMEKNAEIHKDLESIQIWVSNEIESIKKDMEKSDQSGSPADWLNVGISIN